MDSMGEINAPWSDATDLVLPDSHPGKADQAYVRRRKMFFFLAQDMRLRSLTTPLVPYTTEETALWSSLYTQLDVLHQQHAAQVYRSGKQALGLTEKTIPQLQDLEAELKNKNKVTLVPAEGLLHGKTYFSYWANRTMPCTLFLRYEKSPAYTPEPDIVHDVIGHVPPLMDEKYAQLIQLIGKASKSLAPDKLEELVRFYWFTVEFGLIKEGNHTKIFGAGILSSIGETHHVVAGKPVVKDFNLEEIIRTPFDPTQLQSQLFLAPSFQHIIEAADTLLARWS